MKKQDVVSRWLATIFVWLIVYFVQAELVRGWRLIELQGIRCLIFVPMAIFIVAIGVAVCFALFVYWLVSASIERIRSKKIVFIFLMSGMEASIFGIIGQTLLNWLVRILLG